MLIFGIFGQRDAYAILLIAITLELSHIARTSSTWCLIPHTTNRFLIQLRQVARIHNRLLRKVRCIAFSIQFKSFENNSNNLKYIQFFQCSFSCFHTDFNISNQARRCQKTIDIFVCAKPCPNTNEHDMKNTIILKVVPSTHHSDPIAA